MANAQFENLTYLNRCILGKVQTSQTIRISVAEEINEVLSVGITANVNSYEVKDGFATFFGKTSLTFLYNDGVVTGANYSADFTDRLQLTYPSEQIAFETVVVDSKTETSANTATVTVILETTAYGFVQRETPVLVGGEMYCQSQGREVLTGAQLVSLPFTIDEELSAKRKIDTVLCAESFVCLNDARANGGVLTVSGECTVRLTYVTDERIVTDDLPFHFEREIEASTLDNDGEIFATAKVTNTKIRLNISEGESLDFTADVNATVCVEYLHVSTVNVVADAYGESCDFTFQKSKITTSLPCGASSQRKLCESTLPFGNKDANYLTTVNTDAIVTKCTSLGGQALVEGVIRGTMLFALDSTVQSVLLEVPFSQKLDVDYLSQECTPCCTANVLSVSVRQSNELVVESELCFELISHRQTEFAVITEVAEQVIDKSSLPAIEVCMAHKGETLWTLAKSLHMSESDLVSVNTQLTNPLEKDERIVVYNRLQQ